MAIDPILMTSTTLAPKLLSLAGALKLIDPPALVRLEPDSITGDPAPGSEARPGASAPAAWSTSTGPKVMRSRPCPASTSTCRPAAWSACSVRPAPASRRC